MKKKFYVENSNNIKKILIAKDVHDAARLYLRYLKQMKLAAGLSVTGLAQIVWVSEAGFKDTVMKHGDGVMFDAVSLLRTSEVLREMGEVDVGEKMDLHFVMINKWIDLDDHKTALKNEMMRQLHS